MHRTQWLCIFFMQENLSRATMEDETVLVMELDTNTSNKTCSEGERHGSLLFPLQQSTQPVWCSALLLTSHTGSFLESLKAQSQQTTMAAVQSSLERGASVE